MTKWYVLYVEDCQQKLKVFPDIYKAEQFMHEFKNDNSDNWIDAFFASTNVVICNRSLLKVTKWRKKK